MTSPVWHHLFDIICVTSPVWHHLFDITCLTSPVWHHRCFIICVTSPVWQNQCDITCVTSSVWHHLCDITCVTSPVWHHLCDITVVISSMVSIINPCVCLVKGNKHEEAAQSAMFYILYNYVFCSAVGFEKPDLRLPEYLCGSKLPANSTKVWKWRPHIS